jgi:hypothetical protein
MRALSATIVAILLILSAGCGLVLMDQGDNRTIACGPGGACPTGLSCNHEIGFCQRMADAGPPQQDAAVDVDASTAAEPDAP